MRADFIVDKSETRVWYQMEPTEMSASINRVERMEMSKDEPTRTMNEFTNKQINRAEERIHSLLFSPALMPCSDCTNLSFSPIHANRKRGFEAKVIQYFISKMDQSGCTVPERPFLAQAWSGPRHDDWWQPFFSMALAPCRFPPLPSDSPVCSQPSVIRLDHASSHYPENKEKEMALQDL